MPSKNFYPVIQIDPNGPWHRPECWLVAGLDDEDIVESIQSGEIQIDDVVFLFQPNDPPEGERFHEFGYGSFGVYKGNFVSPEGKMYALLDTKFDLPTPPTSLKDLDA